jgi:rod shape-determining protein MreD
MSDFGGPLFPGTRGKRKLFRIRPWVVLVTPLAALLFQVYVPLYFPLARYLELTLLVTVYLAVSRRGPVAGAVTGALIGLVQDSLSNQPIGVFGMVKTVIGYGAASLGVRLDTEHAAVRLGLGCFFFAAHQLLYEAVKRGLLGTPSGLPLWQTLAATLVNGVAGVALFYLLDKLRDRES